MGMKQMWQDSRLSFSHLEYNSSQIGQVNFIDTKRYGWEVWRPSLSWDNCPISRATVADYAVSPDGWVTYRQKLHVRCRCGFRLHKLPFDNQTCLITRSVFNAPSSAVILK